jgi:DNA/RNA-binding domain of Phe-tRNA-synthetase-like protein
MLTIDPHPELWLGTIDAELDSPLGDLSTPAWALELLRPGAAAPLERSEALRLAVRDLLRHGGYKPTGRGKPSSEYLVRAAEEGTLGSINLAVDISNAISLHSGLPVSVVDRDLLEFPLRVALGGKDERYVFNASGQEIDVEGLLCLHDAKGACANAVKDSQRTKTHAATRSVLCVVWGCRGFSQHSDRALAWYRELLERAGAACQAARSLSE